MQDLFPFPGIPGIFLGLVVVAAFVAREVKYYRFKKACAEIETAKPAAG